jgi:hypothetical protein
MAILAAAAAAAGCGRGAGHPVSAAEVRAVKAARLPSAPDDPAWREAPVHAAQLLLQDVVEPRQLAATTPAVEAQALTDGKSVAFRLSWVAARSDATGPAVFPDACAVQLPAATVPDAPSPMMGEAGRPVEITYWRASWQATLDGRPDTLAAIYPNARVDHYPFEGALLAPGSPEQLAMAKRFAPARAVGNSMAGPRDRAVQDLVAEGAGTLRPAQKQVSTGAGKADGAGWSVVIVRPLPAGVRPGTRSQVAFAVWAGSKGEAGGRKMRTGWIPFAVEAP